jgi:maintenance of morphology protein 1
MSAVGAATPAATGSTWTFTQGLILGQASFLFLCLLFIRYVVFSPSEPVDADSWRRKREERAKVSLYARLVQKKTRRKDQLTTRS